MKFRRDIKKQKGNLGEHIACQYLEARGFFIVARQYHTRAGEVDIIAWDQQLNELVFVEVKARTGMNFGWPEESVNAKKKERWRKSAFQFLQEKYHTHIPRYRFDIIAIMLNSIQRTAQVSHFKNIAIAD